MRFIRYGMKEGLSHEMVNCLYNDSRGFLWIGTDFGLNRFDGVRFEKWFHQPGDTNSLLSNKINSISEDKQHRLWLGTDVGVSVYDMHRGLFHSYSEINTGTGVIRNLLHVKTFCDRDGDTWIGSSNGYIILYKQAEKKFYAMNVPLRPLNRLQNEFISGFLHDSRNRIWAGSSYGVYLLDKTGLSATPFRFPASMQGEASLNACTRLFETSGGVILCGTWNAGYLVYDEATARFISQNRQEGKFLPSPVVFDFAQHDSLIYFAGITGVFTCQEKDLHNPGFTNYTRYASDPNDNYTIGSDENSSVVTGIGGNLWIGSTGGIAQWNINSRYYRSYSFVKLVKLPQWSPASIAQRKNQLYLVAEHEVLGFDLRKNAYYRVPLNIRGKKRHGFYEDGDGFSLPGQAGLYLYDRNLKLTDSITELLPNHAPANMLCALHDRNGNLWIGTTRYGIRKIDPLTGKRSRYLDDPARLNSLGYYISAIIETADGMIYAGGKEFYVYNPARDVFEWPAPVAVKNVSRLVEQDHNIWVGTKQGLFCYDMRKHTVTAHPLPPNINQVVNELVVDGNGILWMITLSGIVRYDPVRKSTLLFNSRNGWPGSFSVLKKLDDGRIAAGINGGMILFDPAAVEKQTYSPVPQITRLILDERYTYHLPGNDTVFTVKYKQGIRFNYISLTYQDGEANQYQWQLKGFDDQWHSVGNQTTQVFTSLPPGNYTFSIRSSNAADVWNAGYASVNFRVLPPFYLTWWFITGVILVVVSLAYWLYRYRLKQALALEKLRTRIATDLHDDIGATLSSISFYSEAVKQKIKDEVPDARPILERMGETSRGMVGNMSDIVWAINPVNDAAGALFKRMHSYAAELCQLKNVILQFGADSSLDKRTLDIESRKNIYLIFKEAVNNALKYSGCSILTIRVQKELKMVRMTIADNGRGFSIEEVTSGNGLQNMRMRAGELGGAVRIESAPGAGTSIELCCPIP